MIPPQNSVVPQVPGIAVNLDRSSSVPQRAPVPAPPQVSAAPQAVPPVSAPAAVTGPSGVVPAGSLTQKPPVYSEEDLDRLAEDTIAARPGIPDLEEVRALRPLIDRLLQRGLTLKEIHRILVARHGLKVPYKRFLALLTKVKKQSS
ncbi:MAG: hypothetical protein LH610_11590 [Sphingomonas bacterium]|nr:hypothetical protein [Sphingomonas bacterium]